jgi:1-acyl-sn-glycerol-3-phosphate acyltransferase
VHVDPDPIGSGRDPEFLKRVTPLLDVYTKWYRPEVRGFESLPAVGEPFLLAGNHNGGATPPDLPILLTAWWRERGYEEPVYGLFHSFFLSLPGVGTVMSKTGALDANPVDAERALRAGAPVVVYPGGDHDAFRPWSARDTIDFAGRKGFVRLALRTGVPIVPVTACGVQDSVMVLSRGESLVRWMPWLRPMRVKVMPIIVGAPTGLSLGWPTLPMPTRSIVQLGEPIDHGYGPDAADDEGIVANLYEKVVSTMQATMGSLRRELSSSTR